MQILRDVKSCVEYIRYRRRFLGSRIDFGSRISNGCTIADGARVEGECRITRSSVGYNVFVGAGSSLSDCRLEANTAVYRGSELDDTVLESYSYLGEKCVLRGVDIGRFSSVGAFFLCGLGEHPLDWISTSPVFFSTQKQCRTTFADRDYFDEKPRTRIGNDVWIGARVFVRNGVSIGDGAIIAAGAVVVNDVSPYAVVGGVPAKLIRNRFDESEIEGLLNLKWWCWSEERLKASQSMFRQSDVRGLLAWHEANPEQTDR